MYLEPIEAFEGWSNFLTNIGGSFAGFLGNTEDSFHGNLRSWNGHTMWRQVDWFQNAKVAFWRYRLVTCWMRCDSTPFTPVSKGEKNTRW